jgi:UDP-N-acetylglucosamine 2-epimerase (non-hydrolysing)
MPRIMLVFGTRPEAIKMAPVYMALKQQPAVETVTCVTAQHRQMLDQILEWFAIKPDHDLNLMQPGQTLAGLTARAMEKVTEILELVKPDAVVVQGDTTTAMVAALAAFYQHIPVAHVEAGLRTHNLYNPFPEEVNRHLISVLATFNFAPTHTAEKALLAEGAKPENIFLTGNTVIDALKWTVNRPYDLSSLGIPLSQTNEKLILVTGHRRESFGPAFESICEALKQIAVRNTNVRLVYPVHLNPNVQEPVFRLLKHVDRVHLIEPLPYPAFTHLMAKSYLIISDSGGVQEEAPALGKPVLVMRETTERPEAIEAGTAKLVGTDARTIIREAETLLHDDAAYQRMSGASSPFGDGHSGERIAAILAEQFG